MGENKYTVRRKYIPKVKLVSLTGQSWYDSQDNIVDWSDLPNSHVTTGTTVYNVGKNLIEGYYKYDNSKWNLIVGSPISNS